MLLASVSNAGPQTVRSVRVTEREHAARRTLTMVRSLPGKIAPNVNRKYNPGQTSGILPATLITLTVTTVI